MQFPPPVSSAEASRRSSQRIPLTPITVKPRHSPVPQRLDLVPLPPVGDAPRPGCSTPPPYPRLLLRWLMGSRQHSLQSPRCRPPTQPEQGAHLPRCLCLSVCLSVSASPSLCPSAVATAQLALPSSPSLSREPDVPKCKPDLFLPLPPFLHLLRSKVRPLDSLLPQQPPPPA